MSRYRVIIHQQPIGGGEVPAVEIHEFPQYDSASRYARKMEKEGWHSTIVEGNPRLSHAPGVKFVLGIAKKAGKRVSEVQSVLFDKLQWAAAEAKGWLKSHGFKVPKLDDAASYWRARQAQPGKYKEFRTISAGKRTNPDGAWSLANPSVAAIRNQYLKLIERYAYAYESGKLSRMNQAHEALEQFETKHNLEPDSREKAIAYIKRIRAANLSLMHAIDSIHSRMTGNPTSPFTYGVKNVVTKEWAVRGLPTREAAYLWAEENGKFSFPWVIEVERHKGISGNPVLTPRVPIYSLSHGDLSQFPETTRMREAVFPTQGQAVQLADRLRSEGNSLVGVIHGMLNGRRVWVVSLDAYRAAQQIGAVRNPSGMGIFKGAYRGQGIYWSNGAYNLDGSGYYPTIGDARKAIDRMIELREIREKEEAEAKIAKGAIRVRRSGDTMTLYYPDGTQESMPVREFRQKVFDIEEKWGAEVVHTNPTPGEAIESYQEHLGTTTDPEFQVASPGEQAAAMTAQDLCENPWRPLSESEKVLLLKRIQEDHPNDPYASDLTSWIGRHGGGLDTWAYQYGVRSREGRHYDPETGEEIPGPGEMERFDRTVLPGRNPEYIPGRSRLSPGYRVRFIKPEQAGELMDLFHLAKTALAGTSPSNYDRMIWASGEFHKAHPEISSTAAYKDLEGLRSNWFGAQGNPAEDIPGSASIVIHDNEGHTLGGGGEWNQQRWDEEIERHKGWTSPVGGPIYIRLYEYYPGGKILKQVRVEDGKATVQKNPAYSQVTGMGWQQETYESSSGDARKRAAQLRKLGYRVVVSSLGDQITPVGHVKMTLVDIRPGTSGDHSLEALPDPAGGVVRLGNPKARMKRPNPESSMITLPDGRMFPSYDGQALSWSIGLYMTRKEELEGYPRARAVISAMQEHRPEQLEKERREMLRASFDRMFGHNAKKELELIESETGSRSNPESDAAQLSETFHGRPAETVTEVTEEIHEHEWLTELGDLTELKICTLSGYDATLNFNGKSDRTKLASAENGKQLYIVGGDQSLDLSALHMNDEKWIRDKMVIGEVVELTYRTEKGFDHFKITDYYHKLGEETQVKPQLVYDTLNEKLEIVGGQYHISERGLEN